MNKPPYSDWYVKIAKFWRSAVILSCCLKCPPQRFGPSVNTFHDRQVVRALFFTFPEFNAVLYRSSGVGDPILR